MLILKIQTISAKGKKTRTFRAALLELLTPGNDEHRPVYLSCVGSTQEVRAVVTNIRLGRRAYIESPRHYRSGGWIEIPKTAPYRWVVQPGPDDTATAVGYVAELFEPEVTTLPERVEFVLAAPAWWIDAQAPLLLQYQEDARREAATAGLFASYLDKRTRLPLVNDLAYHWMLWKAAQEEGWCSAPTTYPKTGKLYRQSGTDEAGIEYTRWVSATQETVENCVTATTRRYLEEHGAQRTLTRRLVATDRQEQPTELPGLVFAEGAERQRRVEDGTAGVPRGGWVFPNAEELAQQLRLFGEA